MKSNYGKIKQKNNNSSQKILKTKQNKKRNTKKKNTKNNMAQKRLIKDLKRLHDDPPTGIVAAPEDDDIFHWNAVICGPEETEWEGGTFKLTMEFPPEYPNKPPKVKFVSEVFHPNGKKYIYKYVHTQHTAHFFFKQQNDYDIDYYDFNF